MNSICLTPEKCRITRSDESQTLAHYPYPQVDANRHAWTERCATCGKEEQCSFQNSQMPRGFVPSESKASVINLGWIVSTGGAPVGGPPALVDEHGNVEEMSVPATPKAGETREAPGG